MLWKRVERNPPLLELHNRPTQCQTLQRRFGELSQGAKERVQRSGLSHLPKLMHQHLDIPLICAFVERWQPDTNSFHLPFGEMTIMLHDVQHILGVSVDGNLPTSLADVDLKEQLKGFFGFATSKELSSTGTMKDGKLMIDKVMQRCGSAYSS